MVLQSRLLTGILTGTWKWNKCGDTSFADRRSGKPLSIIAKAEAERLTKVIFGSTELFG